jgi:hypothetical protein
MNCGTIVLCRDNYCGKLSIFCTQFVAVLEENEWDCWFQQDGMRALIAKITTAF